MANRSYLFSTDRMPAKVLDRGEFYDGVGEWSYHTPALALLLISEGCEIGTSVLVSKSIRTACGQLVNVPNLYGRGDGRTAKFLRIIGHMAEAAGDTILAAEVKHARDLLNNVTGRVFVLELIELFEMTSDRPEDWLQEVNDLRQMALEFGQAVDALPDQLDTAARELGAMLDGAGTGPLARLTLRLARDDRARNSAALGLGGFIDTLYFNPVPRADFLAETAERLRRDVILPKVAAVPAPPTGAWALVVERTHRELRDDGTYDRRYAFVLVEKIPGIFGLGTRHAVKLDPAIDDARLTAARLLEWRSEQDKDLKSIAIRPDGVTPLTGGGQAQALIDGMPPKALLRQIFAPAHKS